MKTYKERYQYHKQLMIELLGGQCVNCGSTDRLHFDHVIPADKEFSISKGMTYSLEKLLIEVQKCQLLCNRCHGRKTRSDNPRVINHGTRKEYVYGCRCLACRAANTLHCRQQNSKLQA